MAGAAEAPPAAVRGFRPSIGAIVGFAFCAWGVAIGLEPLNDNSFFTHLATGRLIVDDVGVPSHDPFSFTAPGNDWVVQSWLPAALYGLAERLGDLVAVRLLFGLQTAVLALVVWRLTRVATSLATRLLATGIVLAIGTTFWSERPLLVGLLCVGATLLAADDALDPRWLLPIGWVWVNSHGSFPLGFVVLVVLAVGRRLDGVTPSVELRALRFLALGTVAAAVNPLGPRILVFPVELLARQEILQHVVEWRAPAFTGFADRLFLLELVIAVVAIARRPSYRAGLAVAFAAVVSLLAVRNASVASLVLVPVLAGAFAELGTISSAERPRTGRVAVGVVMASLVLAVAVQLDQPDVSVRQYPVRALAWLHAKGFDTEQQRLVAPDFVGNYVTVTLGEGRRVFVDDRFDMYPTDVVLDSIELVEGSDRWDDVLDRYEADAVVWQRAAPLGSILLSNPEWDVPYVDERWIVACRREGALPCG